MARTMMPSDPEPVADDYIVEREDELPRVPIGIQIIHVFRVVMVVILAAASLALFWMVGTMIGLF